MTVGNSVFRIMLTSFAIIMWMPNASMAMNLPWRRQARGDQT